MDEAYAVAPRDLKRDFQIDRHSNAAIANAFRQLLGQHLAKTPFVIGVQTPLQDATVTQLQETQR